MATGDLGVGDAISSGDIGNVPAEALRVEVVFGVVGRRAGRAGGADDKIRS